MKLYFVRHGETEWNVKKKIQGKTDIPLNENGIRQAKELACQLVEEDIKYLAEHLHTAAPFILDKTQILVGTNGQYTPAIGAALHYVEKFIQSV